MNAADRIFKELDALKAQFEKEDVAETPIDYYYETNKYSIKKTYVEEDEDGEKIERKKGKTLSPNFVMFVPHVHGKINVWDRYNKKRSLNLDKRNYNVLYDKFGRKEDQFVVTVGVLNQDDMHENVFGYSDISYGYLFDILKSCGYDPLLPIRDESYISKKEEELGSIVLHSINKKNPDSAYAIKRKLLSVAKSIADDVKDYISGGTKPDLSGRTISTRKWKDSKSGVSGLYQSGLEMPLMETGQLEEAISCDVEAFISDAKESYEKRKLSAKKKQAKRMRDAYRKKKKHLRRDLAFRKSKMKKKEISKLTFKQAEKIVDAQIEEYEEIVERIAHLEKSLSENRIEMDVYDNGDRENNLIMSALNRARDKMSEEIIERRKRREFLYNSIKDLAKSKGILVKGL